MTPTSKMCLGAALIALAACRQAAPTAASNEPMAANAAVASAAHEVAPAPAAGNPAPEQASPAIAAGTSPCEVQNGKRVEAPSLRLVGTEPFWGGTTQGRCVTYSTPDRPDGTRLWTRVSGDGGGWRYVGALGGQPFTLLVTPKAGCSDGMSDRSYAYAAQVEAGGEVRRGCASKL